MDIISDAARYYQTVRADIRTVTPPYGQAFARSAANVIARNTIPVDTHQRDAWQSVMLGRMQVHMRTEDARFAVETPDRQRQIVQDLLNAFLDKADRLSARSEFEGVSQHDVVRAALKDIAEGRLEGASTDSETLEAKSRAIANDGQTAFRLALAAALQTDDVQALVEQHPNLFRFSNGEVATPQTVLDLAPDSELGEIEDRLYTFATKGIEVEL